MNRIKQLREENRIRQSDLAKAVNVSSAALSGYENDKYEADIDTYSRIANYFSVSLDYLLCKDSVIKGGTRIPVLGRVPAGIPIEAIEEIVDYEDIPASMLAGGKEYFALKVIGDSMYPEFLEGDTVIVRKQQSCNPGEVCVVYVNGYDATLKAVRGGADGSMTLIPRNPAYPPRTYTMQEVLELPVTIAGVVVELRRKVK